MISLFNLSFVFILDILVVNSRFENIDNFEILEHDVRNNCAEYDSDNCPLYVSQNICTENIISALNWCPHACKLCEYKDIDYRCQRSTLNISSVPSYLPGQINHVFFEMKRNYFDNQKVNYISVDPWIVTIDNFMSDEEINTMTSLLNNNLKPDLHMTEWRTSSNAWCEEPCSNHPFIKGINDRIMDITTVHSDNFEHYQLLKYEEGQFYSTHHDYIVGDEIKLYGPRILTFLIYLNDVEDGGETYFNELDISVKPRKGMALLWANVLNSNPMQQDLRTSHESRPVKKGVKYVVNKWIHLYNFIKPYDWGCLAA